MTITSSQELARIKSLVDNMKNDDPTVPTAITTAQNKIKENVNHVKALGQWPDYIDAEASLLSRIPAIDGTTFGPGFDAGIAVALNLIPYDKQALSAKLHANYSQASVEQIRAEVKSVEMGSEDALFSETAHWLLASSVCAEGGVTAKGFVEQVRRFEEIQKILAVSRTEITEEEWDRMVINRQKLVMDTVETLENSYKVLADGTVFTSIDGGLQAAYVNGHEWGVLWAQEYGIFFIGTFHETLGLEDFEWNKSVDENNRQISGPVHGSRQFVKCGDLGELHAAKEIVRSTFQQ